MLSAQALAEISFAESFYISPSGNDSNTGSQASPWKTIGKVNQQNLNPGDHVYFKGGSSFYGQIYLSSEDAGSATNPILIGSYGSGRAIINGSNGTGIYVYNAAGIEIKNIDFLGSGSDNRGDGISFYTDYPDGRKLDFIMIDQVTCSGFQTGISIGSWHSSASGFKNISLQRSSIHGNVINGVEIWGYYFNNNPAPKYSHQSIYVADCEFFDNTGNPAIINNHSGSGLIVGQADGAVIEYCHAYNNGAQNGHSGGGPIAIWSWDSNAIIIQHNVAHDNKNGGKDADGGGFDLDGGCRNSYMQYNYSYNNEGAGFLIAQYSGAAACFNNTIRYNLSVNDGRKNSYGGIALWSTGSQGGIVGTEIYGNTIYMDDNVGGTPSGIHFMSDAISNTKIHNNLFLTKNNAYIIRMNTPLSSLTFKGNGYWQSNNTFKIAWGSTTYYSLISWQNVTGQETHNSSPVGFQGNPLLVAPGVIETITDPNAIPTLQNYRLQTGSPAIGQGLNLPTQFGIDPGIQDLYGTFIPQDGNFDIGSHEVQNSGPGIFANKICTIASVNDNLSPIPNGYLNNPDNSTLDYSNSVGDSSKWRFISISGETYKIQSVLDPNDYLHGGAAGNWTRAKTQGDSSSDLLKWTVISNGSNYLLQCVGDYDSTNQEHRVLTGHNGAWTVYKNSNWSAYSWTITPLSDGDEEEITDLEVADISSYTTGVPRANNLNGNANDEDYVYCGTDAITEYVAFAVDVATAGNYEVYLGVGLFPNGGIFQLDIEGSVVGGIQDLYATGWSDFEERDLGTHDFANPGTNQFRFKIKGKNASSSNYKMRLDYIRLVPVASNGDGGEFSGLHTMVNLATGYYPKTNGFVTGLIYGDRVNSNNVWEFELEPGTTNEYRIKAQGTNNYLRLKDGEVNCTLQPGPGGDDRTWIITESSSNPGKYNLQNKGQPTLYLYSSAGGTPNHVVRGLAQPTWGDAIWILTPQ